MGTVQEMGGDTSLEGPWTSPFMHYHLYMCLLSGKEMRIHAKEERQQWLCLLTLSSLGSRMREKLAFFLTPSPSWCHWDNKEE